MSVITIRNRKVDDVTGHLDVASLLAYSVFFGLQKSKSQGIKPYTISAALTTLRKAVDVLEAAQTGDRVDYIEASKSKMAS